MIGALKLDRESVLITKNLFDASEMPHCRGIQATLSPTLKPKERRKRRRSAVIISLIRPARIRVRQFIASSG